MGEGSDAAVGKTGLELRSSAGRAQPLAVSAPRQPEANDPALCPLGLLEARAELPCLSPTFIIPSGPKKPQPFHPG